VTLRKPGFANRCALLPAHCSRWLAGNGDPRITHITRRHFIVFELPVQLSSYRHCDEQPEDRRTEQLCKQNSRKTYQNRRKVAFQVDVRNHPGEIVTCSEPQRSLVRGSFYLDSIAQIQYDIP
jgi:hypothetical protein